MVLTILLQAVEAEVASLSLLDMAFKGGWIMIPLLQKTPISIYITELQNTLCIPYGCSTPHGTERSTPLP